MILASYDAASILTKMEPCAYIGRQIERFGEPEVYCWMSNLVIFSLNSKIIGLKILTKIWQPGSWCVIESVN